MHRILCLCHFGVVLVLLVSFSECQLYEGDFCTLESTRQTAVCRLLLDCPTALQALQNRQERPQTCGFAGTAPIVCCPQDTPQTTTTTTPTPTTPRTPAIQSRRVGLRSKQKCKEYGKYVYSTERDPVLLIGAGDVEKNECGMTETPLIVGGEDAKEKEFPHMALIGYGSDDNKLWQCGGTLISEKYVLTAAHCLYSRDYGEAKFIRIGDYDINTDTDDADPQDFNIAKKIAYPEYRSPSHYHDIALLQLDDVARLNPYARPACLQVEKNIPTAKAIATGWGRTQHAGIGSDNLLKVTLEMFNNSECNESYKYQSNRRLRQGIVDDYQLCAGSHSEEKDTCQGDSGGPLQIRNNDVYCTYSLIGVTSFGKICGTVNNPGVYTRVSNYIKWIEDTVWP